MNNIIEWKNIYLDGNESSYQISNSGMVINTETGAERIPSLNSNGYFTIILYHHGLSYPFSIHRLVATYFVTNPDIINNTVVDHKDGNKQNNWYWNLEWVTPKENKQRAILMGLDNPHHGNQPKGSESGVSIHTEMDAHNACKLLEQGLSNKQIADMLGLETEFIRSLKRGSWKHVTKFYNIPKPESRLYYSNESRILIKQLIDAGLSDVDIAKKVGLDNPTNYGRKYVNKIRSRYNSDKSSTTIQFDYNL